MRHRLMFAAAALVVIGLSQAACDKISFLSPSFSQNQDDHSGDKVPPCSDRSHPCSTSAGCCTGLVCRGDAVGAGPFTCQDAATPSPSPTPEVK